MPARISLPIPLPPLYAPRPSDAATLCPYAAHFSSLSTASADESTATPTSTGPAKSMPPLRTGCSVRTYASDGVLIREEKAAANGRDLEVKEFGADETVLRLRASTYDGARELERVETWADGTRSERWRYDGSGVLALSEVEDAREQWVSRDVYAIEAGRADHAQRLEGPSFDALAPSTQSNYVYRPDGRLGSIVVASATGEPQSRTDYEYHPNGQRSLLHWQLLGMWPNQHEERYDAAGRLRAEWSESGQDDTFVRLATVHLFSGTQSRGFLTEHRDGSGHTEYAARRLLRTSEGRLARVEVDSDGDCVADGWVEYTRGSADGEWVERRLGTAGSTEAAKRVFSAECRLDLNGDEPALPFVR